MAGDITTIARPYAEAVFDIAKASGDLDAWSSALNALAAVVEDPQIADQVGNPNVPTETLRDLIFGITGEGLTEPMQNMVRVLAGNKRLVLLPEVARLFDQLKAVAEGLRKIDIVSAYAVNATQQKTLAAALKKRFGDDVELSLEKDPDLIGGLMIRAGDIVIDGSVRGKLDQLTNELQF